MPRATPHLPDLFDPFDWLGLFWRFGGACALGLQLACAASAQTVYVSSEKDHAVQVFDAAGQWQKRIAVCKRPRDMKASPDGARIYVVCGDSNQLGVIDRASAKMVGTVPVGESPEMFALSPDGKVAYVSIEDEGVLAAHDIAHKKRLFHIPTGGEPEGVLVSADGQRAYVTSEDASVVHLIDLVRKTVVRDIAVGLRPRRLLASPNGQDVWVSNELSASISVIDTRTQSVRATLKLDMPGMRSSDITPVGMAMTRDGRTAWVSLGRANHVAEVDVASLKVRRTVLTGQRAWGLALSPDERTLYVANGLSDDLTLVDTASAKALRSVPAGRVPHTPLVLP